MCNEQCMYESLSCNEFELSSTCWFISCFPVIIQVARLDN